MYTTEENVKDFTQIEENSEKTNYLIKVASDMIDKYLGYKAGGSNDVQKVFLGQGHSTYFFNDVFHDFQKVEKDGNEIDIFLVEDGFFLIERKNGVFDKGQEFTLYAKEGRFHIDWEGQNHTLPKDIEHACVLLVGMLREGATNEIISGAIKSEKTSQYSVTYADIPTSSQEFIKVKSILDRYKLPFVF